MRPLSRNTPSAYRSLVNSGATINVIHKSVVSFLGLIVEPHLGLLVTLADGKMVLSCSGYVSLSCIVADVSYSGTFFVAPLGAQSLILDMPSLERKNPVIDWQAKTLTPRSNFSPLNPSNTSPTLSVPEPSNPSNPPVLPNLPDPHDPLKHHLPRILPTR